MSMKRMLEQDCFMSFWCSHAHHPNTKHQNMKLNSNRFQRNKFLLVRHIMQIESKQTEFVESLCIMCECVCVVCVSNSNTFRASRFWESASSASLSHVTSLCAIPAGIQRVSNVCYINVTWPRHMRYGPSMGSNLYRLTEFVRIFISCRYFTALYTTRTHSRGGVSLVLVTFGVPVTLNLTINWFRMYRLK